MKHLVALVLVILTVCSAHARLTEKEADLIKRFGSVEVRFLENAIIQGRTYNVGTNLRFRSEQWTITALVVDDRCARITYGKVGDWTEEQIVGLLNRNGGAATFKEEGTGLGKSYRKWKQSDGVTVVFSLNALMFTHPLYERRLALLKAKADGESRRPPKF